MPKLIRIHEVASILRKPIPGRPIQESEAEKPAPDGEPRRAKNCWGQPIAEASADPKPRRTLWDRTGAPRPTDDHE